MCRRVDQPTNQMKIRDTSHRTRYAQCQTRVVYRIPLLRAKCYIGQTSRCISDGIREHATSLKGTAAGRLPAHSILCKSNAAFSIITILVTNKNAFPSEILDPLAIEQHADDSVSTWFITIDTNEKQYFRCATAR